MTGEITYRTANNSDFEALAEIRIEAMRESLVRLGRFDRDRAIERLRRNFDARMTQWILCDGNPVGFFVLRDLGTTYLLDHLYIHPRYQRSGIGSKVITDLIRKVSESGGSIEVGALKESDSNRFYLRHGFRKVSEEVFDNHYRLDPLVK